MTAFQIQLRHSRFFEQLAASDEGDLPSRVASAGLVVLRYVDDWMAGDATDVTLAARAESARDVVHRLPEGQSARALLLNTLDAMSGSSARDMRLVSDLLMGYARSLDFDANWHLAIDVYESVLLHVSADSDAEVVVGALLRRGHCQIEIGALAEATETFRCANEVAESVGDLTGVLRAGIGEAKVVVARGNLPRADAMLDATATRAKARKLKSVWSMATHDRGNIAFLRGDFRLAVRLIYAALRDNFEATNQDRILADLAASFIMLGAKSAARDAYLILASTAREQSQRWLVTINLMELAADAGSRPQFERYKRQLDPEALPARLRVEFELHVGRCYGLFGEFDTAGAWLQRALESAEAQSFNALVFEAEARLKDNAVGSSPGVNAGAVKLPRDIEKVARALREMRELSPAGHE